MRILGQRVLHEQTWTLLKEKSYLDTKGKRRCWTYIERREQRKAAVIVATTERSGCLVLIEQFRIPFEAEIYEVLGVGPGVSTTAGLSTEIVHMVYMRVGEEPVAKPRLEGSERIRVLTIRPEEFGSFLSECERDRRILDAKLYLYLKDRLPRSKET